MIVNLDDFDEYWGDYAEALMRFNVCKVWAAEWVRGGVGDVEIIIE